MSLVVPVLAGLVVLLAWVGLVAQARARPRRRVEALGSEVPSPSPSRVGVAPSRIQTRLSAALRAADLGVGADRAVRVWAGVLAGACGAGLLFGGPLLAVVGGVAAAAGPAVGLRLARQRRARRLERSLPHVLDALASELRGGATLAAALVAVGTAEDGSGEAIDPVARALQAGVPVAEAVDRWQRSMTGPSSQLVAAAVGLAARAGGASSRAVAGVAATLRERLDTEAEAVALAAQARLSAVVIAVAPVAFAALAVLTDPRTADFLFRRPAGLLCLVLGLGLDLVSARWMHRIVGAG